MNLTNTSSALTSCGAFQGHFQAVFPELFFVTAITIILVYGVMYNPSAVHKFPILTKVIGWLSVQALTLTLLLTGNGWNTAALTHVLILNNALVLDDFTLVVKCVILLSALSSIFISFDYIKGQKLYSFEYTILILFATLSMLFIVSSYDLISMYLAIELQSLSFYVIAAFQRNNEFSAEAGLKYFILGALSSGLLLFGESILYGLTGITNFEELTKLFNLVSVFSGANVDLPGVAPLAAAGDSLDSQAWLESHNPEMKRWNWFSLSSSALPLGFATPSQGNAIAMGLLFMLVAFLFKISAVPFHMWAPDVYEGAPTSVTAFFAITPKVATLALLLRLCLYTFYDLIESWQQIIIICSFLSMLIGTLGAINQKKIKRLLAYSSIAHVGYLLIGLATGTIEAVESLLVYIVVYVLMLIGAFGTILAMSKENYHSFGSFSAIKKPSVFGAKPTDSGANGAADGRFVTLHSRGASFAAPLPSPGSSEIGFAAPSPSSSDYANTAYSTGPSASFIYSLCPSDRAASVQPAQPNLRSLGAAPTDQLEKPTATMQLQQDKALKLQTGEAQDDVFHSNWEKKYFKAGQPLWDPYKPLSNSDPWATKSTLSPQSTQFRPALPSIKKKDEYFKSITDLSSLSKTNPTLAVTFAIVLFSNAGIPPLAGFYGKLNVFLAAVEGSMYFLALSGIVCSAAGAFYSIRLIKIIYFHRITQRTWHRYKPLSKESSLMLGLTFFFTLFFFLYPSFLFITTHSAALSLCL